MLTAKGSSAPRSAYRSEKTSRPITHRRGSSGTRSTPSSSDPDADALKVTLLISQQEAEFGVNMFNTLMLSDEREIDELIARGYLADDAIAMIFSRK
jgi:hypothetical protein